MIDPAEHDSHNEILDLEKFPNYLVRNPRSIVQFMTALAEKRCLLSVFLPGGLSFVSAVLSVADDGSWLILDRSPDETLNDRASRAETLTCVTRLEGIRMQFHLDGAERFPYDGFDALRATMPEVLLRLQRRECYRLTVPLHNPVSCRITLKTPTGEPRTTELRVLDISAGGLAIGVQPEQLELHPGATFENCQLVMPEIEPAAVKLKLRNQFVLESRSGAKSIRAGCEFIDLPARVATNVQRYIFKVERDRRTLQPGG